MSLRKKTQNPHHVLKASHTISTEHCDIKLLPEGADTAPGHARQTVSDELRVKIEERIAAHPAPHAQEGPRLLCRICKSAHKNSTPARHNGLPDSPEGIVWHLLRW